MEVLELHMQTTQNQVRIAYRSGHQLLLKTVHMQATGLEIVMQTDQVIQLGIAR